MTDIPILPVDQGLAAAHEASGDSAVARARALRPILALYRQGEPVAAALEAAASELGIDRSHAWRLFGKLKANDGRVSAITPHRSGPKKGSRRLSVAVEKLISQVLRERYLVREPPSLLRIVSEIREECLALGYRAPTRRTVKARLEAMDQKLVVRQREGEKQARRRFGAVAGVFSVARPLQVVQIDHTPADIILVDHVEREALQRPWLTLAIDVATRMVLGVHVGFEPPSVLTVALCLDHCIRDKSFVDKDGGRSRWPAMGIPNALHVDNAQEFKSRAFQAACEEWGIDVVYRPPGRVHFGGHVERLIGTCMGAVHTLPGTTHASPAARGDYDSVAEAALTLSEFEDWLALEISRYHNARHGGLDRSPLAAWAALGGDEASRRVVDVDAFRISFMPAERRRLGRTGVRLFTVTYWADAFAPLIGRISGPVTVKYDPRDLSHIWVLVGEGRIIEARYRDLSHPRISWWEYQAAQRAHRARSLGEMRERDLFAIIYEQRRIAEAARRKTKAARLEIERGLRSAPKVGRDPSRAMFAIDTANPNLPRYDIDDVKD